MSDLKSTQDRRRAALAAMPPLTLATDLWWFGSNDEFYTDFATTREEAIKAALADRELSEVGFHLICARCDPVDLAAHFDVREFTEAFEDNDTDYLTGEGLETVFHAISEAHLDDLETRIQRTIRDWQIELQSQGVEISGDRFTSSSGAEFITKEPTP